MPFKTEFDNAYAAACAADEAYSKAVNAAGFKSRWDMSRADKLAHPNVIAAYNAKIAADSKVHDLFESRRLLTERRF